MTWETWVALGSDAAGGRGAGRVGTFCWCGELSCHVVWTHTLSSIFRSDLRWTVRSYTFYILVMGQFLKLILRWILFFFLLFFFLLNTGSFFKRYLKFTKQQFCNRFRIISRFLTSQYIYTWLIRNRKTLSLSPTNSKKQRKDNFRDAKVKGTPAWSNCTFLTL